MVTGGHASGEIRSCGFWLAQAEFRYLIFFVVGNESGFEHTKSISQEFGARRIISARSGAAPSSIWLLTICSRFRSPG